MHVLCYTVVWQECILQWVHITACACAYPCGGVKLDEACRLPTDMSSVLLLLLRTLQITCQIYL